MAPRSRAARSFGGADLKDVEVSDNGHEDGTLEEATIFDAFAASVKAQPKPTYTKLKVPARPETVLVYRTDNIDFDTYQMWVRKSTPKKGPDADQLNFMKLSSYVIPYTNVWIEFQGTQVERDGVIYTVTSQKFHELMGAPMGSTMEAVRLLFGNEAHIIQTMKKIVVAAGYSVDGEMVEEADDGPLQD